MYFVYSQANPSLSSERKTMTQITSILGVTKDIRHTWPDGSFECPHCCTAVFAPNERCDNPACSASKWATPANRERFQAAQDRHDEDMRREQERKRNHEIAMRRITEDRERSMQARAEFVARVRAVNGCVRCSDQYHDRVRRHRGACPKAA